MIKNSFVAEVTFNEYNNAYHSTIKMKPIDVKSSTYIDFGVKSWGLYEIVKI